MWNAFRLLAKNPRLWPSAAAPMILAALGNIGLLAYSLGKIIPFINKLAEDNHWPNALGGSAAGTLVVGAWILVAEPVFLILFGVFSVPAWDALSKQVEIVRNGSAATGKLGCGLIGLDICVRITLAVLLSGTAVLLGCLGFGLVGAVLCGWLMLFDLSAPTFARRNAGIFRQYRLVFKCKGWQGFWLVASLASIFPIVNVLMLPVLVVAATLLVLESEPSLPPPAAQPVE